MAPGAFDGVGFALLGYKEHGVEALRANKISILSHIIKCPHLRLDDEHKFWQVKCRCRRHSSMLLIGSGSLQLECGAACLLINT